MAFEVASKVQDNKLFDLLAEFHTRGVVYVSWKNNHQLNESLTGNGDVDLFVPAQYRSTAINLCRVNGWLELVNPVSIHPWISHFYCMDEDGTVFHIHFYFKIITGETWIKEYSIPLDDWITSNRIWSEKYQLWILKNDIQAYLFVMRHLLKNASITGRALYTRELASYESEWDACRDSVTISDFKAPFDLTPYLKKSGLFDREFTLPSYRSSVLFRLSLFPFLRLALFSLFLRRVHCFAKRVVNLFYKRKKNLPGSGLILAISGVDGSGKTTMLEEIHKEFGKFLTVNRFHIGRPQGKVIEFIWRIAGNKSENSSIPGASDIITVSSISKSINGAILALLRLRLARLISNQAELGGLMLVDRWPTDELGKMDGPRIILGDRPGWLQKICKRTESWAYARMPLADICLFFIVPVEVATERNRLRIKDNKESESQIIARFNGNIDYSPLARKTIRFENTGDFSEKRGELLRCVWHEILSRY